jgi:fused signal recognition particle receptor
MNLMNKISIGLSKTRAKMAKTFQAVFGEGIDREQLEQLEEFLLLADVGPGATAKIVQAVEASENKDVTQSLRDELIRILDVESETDKRVKVFVGINGTGKTTSAGKLCYHLKQKGQGVFVIGADTFRAAADMQLEEWCRRTGAKFMVGKPGSDPGSVVFDGLNSGSAREADVVICDTAGRLHVNKNLMQELEKIVRVAEKVCPGSVEVLLTLDAGMGQNALEQMEIFHKWVKPTGIILTKLDGSARGGVAVALVDKYKIPIKYVGVGEGLDDLVSFDALDYVNSLLPGKTEK